MTLSPNVQGALWMSASMMGFGVNDALIKSVSGEVPLFQAIFVRGALATILILVIAFQAGALRFRPVGHDRWRIAGRVGGEIAGTCLFLTALFNMPLGNATAIISAASLAVTLGAAQFFGEPVGWRRYAAIAVGFFGVLLIVKPGTDGFNIFALAAVAAIGFVMVRDLSTRRFSPEVPALFVTTLTAASITAVAGAVTVTEGWVPMDREAVLRLAGAAAFILIGYNAGVQCMRVGEVAAVAPFRYTNLIWALLLGFLMFGEVPGPVTAAGAALIVGAGLYTLHRERLRSSTP